MELNNDQFNLLVRRLRERKIKADKRMSGEIVIGPFVFYNGNAQAVRMGVPDTCETYTYKLAVAMTADERFETLENVLLYLDTLELDHAQREFIAALERQENAN